MQRTTKISALGATLAIGGMLAFSGQAMADQVKADYLSHQGGNINTNVGNGGGGRFKFDRDDAGGDEFGGILNTDGGPTNLGGTDNLYYAFCLEPNEALKDGYKVYDVVALADAPDSGVSGAMGDRAEDLKLLFGNVYPDFSQSIDTQTAIALQIAVWEIANESTGTYDVINDGPSDTTKGDFYVANQNAARAQAQEWLDEINNDNWTEKADGLVALIGPENRQDFVAQVVPIPAAAWLFGSALFGMAGIGYRRGRKV